jgi:DNA-binding response OmpR family regulator
MFKDELMLTVAVVEDNADLREDIAFHLDRAGFSVISCADAEALDRSFDQVITKQPSILVLDVGLPREDGYSIARRYRAACSGLGIIMLTARTQLEDRLTGLETGADNYLCKPVDMRELVSVVRARARSIRPIRDQVHDGFWRVHTCAWQLDPPGGDPVCLTASEYRLLKYLATCPGHEASRGELIAALGQDDLDYDERRLEILVSRLRRKIADAADGRNLIRSQRKQGYAFIEPMRLYDPSNGSQQTRAGIES